MKHSKRGHMLSGAPSRVGRALGIQICKTWGGGTSIVMLILNFTWSINRSRSKKASTKEEAYNNEKVDHASNFSRPYSRFRRPRRGQGRSKIVPATDTQPRSYGVANATPG